MFPFNLTLTLHGLTLYPLACTVPVSVLHSVCVAYLRPSCLCLQSANRRPNTYKMLTLSCIRSHGDELGILLPDVMTMSALSDKTFVKVRDTFRMS